MEIRFKEDSEGLLIDDLVAFDKKVNLLCGKNGSGKSRFLRALKNSRKVELTEDDNEVDRSSIMHVLSSNMINVGRGQSVTEKTFEDTYAAIVATYNRYLAEKESRGKTNLAREVESGYRSSGLNLSSQDFEQFVKSAAQNFNKDLDSLTDEELKATPLDVANKLNVQNNISYLCFRFLWLKKQNLLQKFYYQQGYEKALVYDFDEMYPDAPWVVINKILAENFDVEWEVVQDEDFSSSIKPVKFQSKKNGSDIDISKLSDGEKTILWIACAFINQKLESRALEGCKLILLDEPDAFLHPRMMHCFISVVESLSKSLDAYVVFTTHSPTTVALAKNCDIYHVESNKLTLISQDKAIKELLDGVDFIAVSPENRRTVYVEGYVDRRIYELYHQQLIADEKINNDLTVTFVEAAPRSDFEYVECKIRQHWKDADLGQVKALSEEINGQGSCQNVKGQVKAFRARNRSGDNSIYGIIDRDKNNKSGDGLIVLCHNEFYALDNVVMNTITLTVFLYRFWADQHRFKEIFSSLGFKLGDILEKPDKLQEASNTLTSLLLEVNNDEIAYKEVQFNDGNTYMLATELIDKNGHRREDLIKSKISFLAERKFTKEGVLKEEIVKQLIEEYGSGYFPKSFTETFGYIV